MHCQASTFLNKDENVFVWVEDATRTLRAAGFCQFSASVLQTRQLVVDLAADQHVNLSCREHNMFADLHVCGQIAGGSGLHALGASCIWKRMI